MLRLISIYILAISTIAVAPKEVSADEARLGKVVRYDGKRNGNPVWEPVRITNTGYCKLSGAGKCHYRFTFVNPGVVLFQVRDTFGPEVSIRILSHGQVIHDRQIHDDYSIPWVVEKATYDVCIEAPRVGQAQPFIVVNNNIIQ